MSSFIVIFIDEHDFDPYVRVEDIEDGVGPISLGFVKLSPDLLAAGGR